MILYLPEIIDAHFVCMRIASYCWKYNINSLLRRDDTDITIW